METTFVENAGVEARGSAGGCSFEVLAEAWARLGAPVPVAIVASIADDLLVLDGMPVSGGVLRFEDVVISALGVASSNVSLSVEAISVFVVRALGDHPPAAALPMIGRFSTGGARDAAQLRVWLRDVFGTAIAPHDEVARLVMDALTDGGSADLPAIAEAPLGTAAAAIDFVAEERETLTEIMPAAEPVDPAEPSETPDIPILSAIPAPTLVPEKEERPVIRHQLQKPSVSVHSAPAARRSAKPVADPRDSLRIPDDRPHWGAWLFVILLLVIGALFWLRYL